MQCIAPSTKDEAVDKEPKQLFNWGADGGFDVMEYKTVEDFEAGRSYLQKIAKGEWVPLSATNRGTGMRRVFRLETQHGTRYAVQKLLKDKNDKIVGLQQAEGSLKKGKQKAEADGGTGGTDSDDDAEKKAEEEAAAAADAADSGGASSAGAGGRPKRQRGPARSR